MDHDAPRQEEIDIPHPEEMKAAGRLRLGPLSIEGLARTTPAGLITAAIFASAVLLPILIMTRRPRG